MPYDPNEIIETIHMTEVEHLDISEDTRVVATRQSHTAATARLPRSLRSLAMTLLTLRSTIIQSIWSYDDKD